MVNDDFQLYSYFIYNENDIRPISHHVGFRHISIFYNLIEDQMKNYFMRRE